MGVEPTAACSAQPATSFEDWGAHRDTTTPDHGYSRWHRPWQAGLSRVITRGQAAVELARPGLTSSVAQLDSRVPFG